MIRQVWVCRHRVSQGRDRYSCCHETGGQHADNKNSACLAVQPAAFFTGDRYPDRDEAHGSRDDMNDHQCFEYAMGRQAHIGSPYCVPSILLDSFRG